MLKHHTRFLAPLLVAVLAAVTVSACGGGSKADAQKIIDQTFGNKAQIKSGKLTFALSAKLDATGVAKTQVGDKPIEVEITGPFDGAGTSTKFPQFDFDLTAKAAGQSATAGAVSTDRKLYISYQGKDYEVPNAQFKQIQANFAADQRRSKECPTQSLSELGTKPRNWISDPTSEGTQKVGGTETDHVSADLNVGAFLNDIETVLKNTGELSQNPKCTGKLNRQQRQALRESQKQFEKGIPAETKKQIEDALSGSKIEVWSGKDDHILRKLQLKFAFKLPENLKSQSQGIEGGDVDLTIEIADVNKPQTINAPKNPKKLSDLQNLLAASPLGALGGVTGTTPPTGSSTTPTPPTPDNGAGPPDTEQAQKLLECIQKAEGDPAKIQKCQSQIAR